jgi:hypothetical protein
MIIHWDLFRFEMMESLTGLSSFLETMEAQLEEVHRIEESRMKAVYDSFKPKDADDLAEFSGEFSAEADGLRHRYEVLFPRILRYSLATQLFMFVETNFDKLCDEIAKRRTLALRSRDLKGSLFDRVKLFTEKVAGLPMVEEKNWQALMTLQKVRDCIVHAGGNIEASRDRDFLRQLISKNQGLAGPDEDGLLQIEHGFSVRMIAEARAAFNQVFEAAGFGPEVPKFETE